MSGINAIKAEQSYQRSHKGYTKAHDQEHDDGELGRAAAVYAVPEGLARQQLRLLVWPHGWEYKPARDADVEHRIRELAKAGAMIASEIDRLEAQ